MRRSIRWTDADMRAAHAAGKRNGPAKRRKRSLPPSNLLQTPLAAYFPLLPKPVSEHRFAPPRRWRFDLAWPDLKIAVEQEGGLWVTGRHNRAHGYIKDMEKYNHAALNGWRVFRFTPQQIRSLEACNYISFAEPTIYRFTASSCALATPATL